MPSKMINSGTSGGRPRKLRRGVAGLAALVALSTAAIGGSNTSEAATLVDPVVTASASPGILAPPDAIVGEGDGTVNFAVTLAEEGTETVTVGYQTSNQSAGAGASCNADYSLASGTLTFAPGERSKLVPIQIRDCADVEGFESLTLNLHTPVNGEIWRESSRISIVDNDTVVATPRLIVRDAVVDENAGMAFVSVLLGGTAGQASNSTVTVNYTTADGTALADSDYSTRSGAFTFSPGDSVKTVAIPITPDDAAEGVESFALTLSNPNNASIADGSAVVTIGASDAANATQPAILAPVDLVVGEGDGFVDLVVALSQPGLNPVTVDYATANASAGAGNSCNADYSPANGELHFAVGETTKAVRVQIDDCADTELFEAFTFGLSSPVNAAITRASGRISIVDNDNVVATPKLTARDAVVDERDGFAYVSVLLGAPGAEASNILVSVDYATASDSASAGSDFTGVTGTLRFAPGETAKTVVVPITDDGSTEGVESFALTWSNPNQATISDASGRVVIGASDGTGSAQPRLLATPDLIFGEADGWADLVVSLSQPGLNAVTVDYASANASAGAGNSCNADYSPANGELHFAVGETTKAVRVQINDCADIEPSETFNFNLSAAVNGSISDATGVTTICDNDGPVGLCSIAVTPANPSIAVGANQQFSATATYSDASTTDVTATASWGSTNTGVAGIGAGGLAHALSAGTSTISATQSGISGSTVLTVTGPGPGPVGPAAQTITFGLLANKGFGDPDFTVSASASSSLPVGFAAAGNCTISGQTVHISSAGSCTITASQPGNASYQPAPSVSRSFTIGKASQTITFGPLANKRLGDPDFAVAATASSGLPVVFVAGGRCSVSGTRVHLLGLGSCTITAMQAGNVNYNAAAAVERTFQITARPPIRCRVPRVLGKQLAGARSALSTAHCRTGTVTRVFSRTKRKGVVIGQSRRPGSVLPANARVNLVVSRGRRR